MSWFQPSGVEMTDEALNTGYGQCAGVRFPGDCIGDVNERGEPMTGDSMVLLVNAHHETIPFTLPTRDGGSGWERLIDTSMTVSDLVEYPGGNQYDLRAGRWSSSDRDQSRRMGMRLVLAVESAVVEAKSFFDVPSPEPSCKGCCDM